MPGAGEEQVGRVLGRRYRLVAPVGAGASAMVFVADDVVLKRRVAVKLLHPSLADDPMFLKRFRAEAQAAAALNHPNIMAVYDWGEDDGTPFLVTEYLSGGSLRSMLDRNRLLTPSQALLVGLDAARGLDYAHRRGFVHRDIKPANLLFDDDAGCASPTSGWPGRWPRRPGPSRRAWCSAPPATPRPSRPAAWPSTARATSTPSPSCWSRR